MYTFHSKSSSIGDYDLLMVVELTGSLCVYIFIYVKEQRLSVISVEIRGMPKSTQYELLS